MAGRGPIGSHDAPAASTFSATRALGLLRRPARREPEPSLVRTLRNDTRRRILRIIQSRPGIQPFHIWKEARGAMGVTLRGLQTLEKAGLVRSLKIGRTRHYYENSPRHRGSELEVMAILQLRTVRETMQALRQLGEGTQKQVADLLGLSISTASERLAALQRLEFVRLSRSGGVIKYTLANLPGTSDESRRPPQSVADAVVSPTATS